MARCLVIDSNMENQKEIIGSLILKVYLNAFIVDPDLL